jgi:hypothetical protein
MSESLINLVLYSEEAITEEPPDVALEVAAGQMLGSRKSLYHCILLRIGHLSRASPHRLGSVITRLDICALW